MSYRRFKIPETTIAPATVATIATVHPATAQTVANVAGVAGGIPESAFWQVFFDERAGIAEFDGGLPRDEAEARAFACCVVEWLNQHPRPSAPGSCAYCGGPGSLGATVLPFGTEPGTHVWLHAECWPAWAEARQVEAIAALQALGVAGFESGKREDNERDRD